MKGLSRLLGMVLVTVWARLASAEPPSAPPDGASANGRPSVCDNLVREIAGYKIPGRTSQMPWEFFLGNASHQLIAYIYDTRHPTEQTYYNKRNIKYILDKTAIGDSSLLPKDKQDLRPDITNVNSREVFEIKPTSPEGLQDGIQKLQIYLSALNYTLPPTERFSAGKQFEGEILVQFAQGQYIWRLEWCTNTPGVTQYRWTRTQQRFDSSEAAYNAGQWTEISEQELTQYGGRVSKAITGMVDRRERLATLSGAVGVAIDAIGEVALILLSTASPDEQSTAQPEGKILPFPSKAPSTGTSVQLPKASGL